MPRRQASMHPKRDQAPQPLDSLGTEWIGRWDEY
jgi:hypothetical protein